MDAIDFSSITESINEWNEKLNEYVENLSQLEKIGWMLIGGGILLLVVGAILL